MLRIAFLVLLLTASAASAERRIALVIGNGGYQNVQALANPGSDAKLIAGSLQAVGFEVTLLLDADQVTMKTGIADFGRALRDGGTDTVGLFYYAGHGVQSDGANFLIPVDAVIRDEADLSLVGVEADWVLRQMESARNRTNIVILDACRNNPFAGSNKAGLAEMDAPTGSFLSYATAPGSVAVDGDGTNSPFSDALSRAIQLPGLPIEQVFKQVRVGVLEATNGQQTPWDSSSLTDEFVFSTVKKVDKLEALLWNSVKGSADREQIRLFLDAYPDGTFAEAARGLLLSPIEATEPVVAPVDLASAEETALFNAAMTALTREGFVEYLAAYPNGLFSSLAQAEIDNIDAKSAVATVETPVAEPPEVQAEQTTDFAVTVAVESFTAPISQGEPQIVGKSLAELIEGSPLFPPIEGLPDEVWKGKQCKDCHKWKQENLCGQAEFYAENDDSFISRKEHPYGYSFKQNLRLWAQAGCP